MRDETSTYVVREVLAEGREETAGLGGGLELVVERVEVEVKGLGVVGQCSH